MGEVASEIEAGDNCLGKSNEGPIRGQQRRGRERRSICNSEEVFVIDEKVEVKVDLAKVRPLKIEEPIDNFEDSTAEPKPSTLRATVAEVRLGAPPPAPDLKWDPFDLAPRARFSPPPPANRAKKVGARRARFSKTEAEVLPLSIPALMPKSHGGCNPVHPKGPFQGHPIL